MSELLNVSASPHVRKKTTTKDVMADVVTALIPAMIFGVFNFGLNALLILLTSVVTCLLTEYYYQKWMGRPVMTRDLSAVVTGILLAFCLPSTAPLWLPVIGGVFAVVIVKQLYGGLGQNIMNPALAARCFLAIAFPARMIDFAIGVTEKGDVGNLVMNGAIAIDGVTGATPLAACKAGESVDLYRMFLGTTGGTIGETSVLALLLGAGYLLARKVITLRIPLAYIGTFALFILLFGGKGMDGVFLVTHLFGGGLVLGAFYMATDYVTSPITPKGQILYGVALGLLTGVFRVLGSSAEGVSFAIIFCNLLVPLIEKVTMPKPFGKEKSIREKTS